MTSREKIREIFRCALAAVSPEGAITRAVSIRDGVLLIQDRSYTLAVNQRIHICGSGKASARMALALESMLGDRLDGGIVVTNETGHRSGKLTFLTASHPLPTEKSLSAAEALKKYLERLTDGDFCIYLLSGGSSALVESPLPPVTLSEFQETSSLMLKSGMRIGDMNTIRKHLSSVKGGRLGERCAGQVVVLVISDVIGDDLATIGSGPFFADPTTYKEARRILDQYDLWRRLPEAVRRVIDDGLAGKLPETVKAVPGRIRHHVLGSNTQLLDAARSKAECLGMTVHVMTSTLFGEAGEVAKVMISIAREITESGNPFPPPVCLLFGGETTVTVRGKGRGGRNQQLCLAFLSELDPSLSCTLLSAGSDGIDGNSDAAGALVHGDTITRMNRLGLIPEVYLRENDAYRFFLQTDDLLMTGPTGTNVMDIQILYVDKPMRRDAFSGHASVIADEGRSEDPPAG